MDCRTTSIKSWGRQHRAGMTVMELLISVTIGSFVTLGIASLMFYTGRSFAAMANYVDLDRYSRNALDVLTREIRQANRVIEMSSSRLSLEDWDGETIRYIWDPTAETLTRYRPGEGDEELLRECVGFEFTYYQRNPRSGRYDYYPTATPDTCKLVQMRWTCRRLTLGSIVNTESVQSAKVVIRKQTEAK